MWTKRQIIDAAFAEIGLGMTSYDLRPEDVQDALVKMDSLIANWAGKGIVSGYVVTDDPAQISISGDSGIAANLIYPVIANLAVSIAPMYGKQPSAQTLKAAREGYSTALNTIPLPKKTQNVTVTPAGAGYRGNYNTARALSPDETP